MRTGARGEGLGMFRLLIGVCRKYWTLINFAISSGGSMVIDIAAFTLICVPLQVAIGRDLAIVSAVIGARLISGHCNYFYNQRFVFKSVSTWKSYFQYWGLVIVFAALQMLFTQQVAAAFDVNGIYVSAVQFLGMVILFVASFVIQKCVIFKSKCQMP